MSKLIDANNHSTQFGFSSKGQQQSRALPGGQAESYEYDVRQRQSLQISFEGIYKQTVYDDSSVGVLRAELWSHFWPNCDGRDLGVFFEVLAELI